MQTIRTIMKTFVLTILLWTANGRLHEPPRSRGLELYPEVQEALNPPGLCNSCVSNDDCVGDLVCHAPSNGPLTSCFAVDVPTVATSKNEVSNKVCSFPVAKMIGYSLISEVEQDFNGMDIGMGDPPLGLCTANCEEDSDCQGGLVCFFRGSASDPVPGCTVKGNDGIGGNFCVKAVYKNTESYFSSLVVATEVPMTEPNTTMSNVTATNHTIVDDIMTEEEDEMAEDYATVGETVAPTMGEEEEELPLGTTAPTAGATDVVVPESDSTNTIIPSTSLPKTSSPSEALTEVATVDENMSTSQPTVNLETYQGVDWADLPDNVREALLLLGDDQESWEAGEETEVDRLYWNLLTSAQQEAATFLGFDQQSWDGEDSWSAMSADEQAAATRLGYDEFSWNFDIPQEIDDNCWEEMDADQQADAEILGYDQESWDQGEC